MTKVEFPLTLAAVQKGEKAYWAIGDALSDEIEVSGAATLAPEFERCAKMLAKEGYPDYSVSHLRKLRLTAISYPKSKRRDDVSFSVHLRCGNPENFDKIVAVIEKWGKPIITDNVELVVRKWREKDEEKRKEEHEQAKQKRADAKAAKEKAKAEKKKAKDEAARKAAEKREQEAREEEEAAKKQISETSAAPRTAALDTPPPEPSELVVSAACLELEADAKLMAKKLKINLDKLDRVLDRIEDVDFVNGIVDSHEAIVVVAQQIIGRFKKKRFQVLQGGAA